MLYADLPAFHLTLFLCHNSIEMHENVKLSGDIGEKILDIHGDNRTRATCTVPFKTVESEAFYQTNPQLVKMCECSYYYCSV